MVITQNLKPGVYRESYRKAIPDEVGGHNPKYIRRAKESLTYRGEWMIYYHGYPGGLHTIDVIGGKIGFDSWKSEADVLAQFDEWVLNRHDQDYLRRLAERQSKAKQPPRTGTKEERFIKRLQNLEIMHPKPITKKQIQVVYYSRDNNYIVRYCYSKNNHKVQSIVAYAPDKKAADELAEWALPIINAEIKRRSTEL